MFRVGIDIGGTKISIGIFDEKEKHLLGSKRASVKEITSLAEYVKETVTALAEEHNVPLGEIALCGVGIPGTVSDDGRRILKAPNIKILSESLADELEASLGIPVLLVQDSRAAAWGEYLVMEEKPRALICVTLGTGIGTGIVLNGQIYHGSLGSAGELGHLPVKETGRPCGCGKCGCLEKYAAGGGLDMTAEELLGEGKTASDLFLAAKSGLETAKKAIEDAIRTLGGALVSIINLLSPDCILFSGGLSMRKEEYLLPLISYIKEHAYSAEGRLPVLRAASLQDASPLYGAALLPGELARPVRKETRRPLLSASIMCADVLHYEDALKEIEQAGIEYVHADIMDNHFVPNLMLPPELLNRLHAASHLPFDFHIMTERPESVIERLSLKEGDIVSVHYESTKHLSRVVSLVKERGARIGVAINPATPVSMLEEIVSELDMVLIMTVNPGFAGQKIVPGAFEKIRRTRAYLDERGLSDVLIQVDGNCSFLNSVKMKEAGADILVAGSSSVFHPDFSISLNVQKLSSLFE